MYRLKKRGSIYYYRLKLPKVATVFVEYLKKTEIVKSLRTKNYYEACYLRSKLDKLYEGMIKEMCDNLRNSAELMRGLSKGATVPLQESIKVKKLNISKYLTLIDELYNLVMDDRELEKYAYKALKAHLDENNFNFNFARDIVRDTLDVSGSSDVNADLVETEMDLLGDTKTRLAEIIREELIKTDKYSNVFND